jgi:hypothetical protein
LAARRAAVASKVRLVVENLDWTEAVCPVAALVALHSTQEQPVGVERPLARDANPVWTGCMALVQRR